ncbi:uncharacterized protein LOC120350248 [Nilaparvata lugens]|uniref:uncharacterized protein LOC120350248 n=1 Tax=Nilaparvata lugens TaxID=108931 RepID=UPI00193C9B03|nr:uncharacterized protein LOC120350248 [Nilaparvata lugens]
MSRKYYTDEELRRLLEDELDLSSDEDLENDEDIADNFEEEVNAADVEDPDPDGYPNNIIADDFEDVNAAAHVEDPDPNKYSNNEFEEDENTDVRQDIQDMPHIGKRTYPMTQP